VLEKRARTRGRKPFESWAFGRHSVPSRRAILLLVLGQGLRTAGFGLLIGVVGAVVLTRYLQSLLLGVESRDPAVFTGVTLLLLLVAMTACYIRARRATRIEPMKALREA